MGKKKILVIGGTYFAGRVFVMLASSLGYELTLLNRGKYSMAHLSGVGECICDRRDTQKIRKLPLEKYDAVVDFCAYEPGDVETLWDAASLQTRRYILISTADVCKPSEKVRTEESPLRSHEGEDPASQYAYRKRLLEDEVRTLTGKSGKEYVILRPSFVFGPFNYAPREPEYIRKIVRGETIRIPADADGKFQMVYVTDMARAILACAEKDAAADQVYHLAAPEVLDYQRFVDLFAEVSDRPFKVRSSSVEEMMAAGDLLPFPLMKEENEIFGGGKICSELGVAYTPMEKAFAETYRTFRKVYEQ